VVGIDNSARQLATARRLASEHDMELTLVHGDAEAVDRLDWTEAVDDPGGVEFTLPVADWFWLFARTGFEVVDYQELRNPDPDRPDAYGISRR
jgi:hypothetical protein